MRRVSRVTLCGKHAHSRTNDWPKTMGGFRLHRSLCLVCGEGNRRNCNTMHLVRVLWVGQEIPTVSSNFFWKEMDFPLLRGTPTPKEQLQASVWAC